MTSFTLSLVKNTPAQPPRPAQAPSRTTATSVSVRYSGIDARVGTSAADYLTTTTGISYPVLHEALRQESPGAAEDRPELPGEFGAELQRMLDLVRERLSAEDKQLDQIQDIAAAYAGAPGKLRLIK